MFRPNKSCPRCKKEATLDLLVYDLVERADLSDKVNIYSWLTHFGNEPHSDFYYVLHFTGYSKGNGIFSMLIGRCARCRLAFPIPNSYDPASIKKNAQGTAVIRCPRCEGDAEEVTPLLYDLNKNLDLSYKSSKKEIERFKADATTDKTHRDFFYKFYLEGEVAGLFFMLLSQCKRCKLVFPTQCDVTPKDFPLSFLHKKDNQDLFKALG